MDWKSLKIAFSGQVMRGDQSLSKAFSYSNNDEQAIKAGRFVARNEDGCANVKDASDKILGVSVRTLLTTNVVERYDQVSVMPVAHGDAIAVDTDEDVDFAIGDKVYISLSANKDDDGFGYAGTASKAGIPTPFIVDQVGSGIVVIVRDPLYAGEAVGAYSAVSDAKSKAKKAKAESAKNTDNTDNTDSTDNNESKDKTENADGTESNK